MSEVVRRRQHVSQRCAASGETRAPRGAAGSLRHGAAVAAVLCWHAAASCAHNSCPSRAPPLTPTPCPAPALLLLPLPSHPSPLFSRS
jgi:hypothetical protein